MKRPMKRMLIAATLAVAPVLAVPYAFAASPTPAAADQAAPDAKGTPSPRAKMMFWFLDRNGDGFIDAGEIQAFRTARFQSLDANGDGVLTKAEAIAALDRGGPWGGKGPRGHGRDGHGQNGKMDADKASVRQQRFAERQEKRQERALDRLGFTGTVEQITLAEFVAKEPSWLSKADTDKDGKISQAEFLAGAAKGKHGPSAE